MLAQLSTVKSRLHIDQFDLQYDAILTAAIKGLSQRFDKETNRTLARAVDLTTESDADETEIIPSCYPIETVTKFELKSTGAERWVEQTDIEFLIRRSCVISLASAFGFRPSTFDIRPSDFGFRPSISLA
jgi:hypothetical protein